MANSVIQHRRLASDETTLPPGAAPGGSRTLILSAALRLIAERGYGGTSVRDIAKEAGLQPATMYAHYPSKEHVLAELIRIGHEVHQQMMRAAMLETSADPREQLSALVRAHVRMHAEYPMLAMVANAELHALSPEAAGPAVELRKQSEQLLGDVVQRGMQKGVFKLKQPFLALAAIGAMGIRISHWYTPDFALSVDEVADEYAAFALKIVGAGDD